MDGSRVARASVRFRRLIGRGHSFGVQCAVRWPRAPMKVRGVVSGPDQWHAPEGAPVRTGVRPVLPLVGWTAPAPDTAICDVEAGSTPAAYVKPNVIPFPAHRVGLAGFGHQWKPVCPRMRSWSLPSLTHWSATTRSRSTRVSRYLFASGSSTCTPEGLGRPRLGSAGRQVDEADALGEGQARGGVPVGVVARRVAGRGRDRRHRLGGRARRQRPARHRGAGRFRRNETVIPGRVGAPGSGR